MPVGTCAQSPHQVTKRLGARVHTPEGGVNCPDKARLNQPPPVSYPHGHQGPPAGVAAERWVVYAPEVRHSQWALLC